ncbi:hypothetical protein TIFTF001_038853 [Ficus carica]|uniref:Cytochrome P450 n=1 Tax=Ficus carica TaxID=3494 RepID=A0AA88EB98_FICCA|nr:hypothetical protein TIFTF001_038853 [Ficus carica]
MNTWAIGRDYNVWSENVEEFHPKRFIGFVTVQFVLAQLVHCFSWELPNGMKSNDVDMTEVISMGRANHLVAKPTYRLVV